MNRIALALLLAVSLMPAAFAQDSGEHLEAGAYADYFHLSQTNTSMAGLGGRLGINASPHLQFEAEMNYDFEQAFTETFTNGGTVALQRTNLRLLHGLFGPKLQTQGPIQFFVTIKGGFMNFRMDPRPATFATFTDSVANLRANDVSGVLYPGGGIEGHVGPVGLRLDVGDEIYFANGARHNLRVSFGPVIRF